MADLENRVSHLETKVSVIETKVDAFIQEMRDFKAEMRDRDNQRAAEIARIEARTAEKIEALRQEHEKDNVSRYAKESDFRSEVRNGFMHLEFLIIVAMITGIVFMVYGAMAFMWFNQHRANRHLQYQAPPAQTQAVQTSHEGGVYHD